MSEFIFPICGGAAALLALVIFWRSGRFLRALLFTVVTGNAALFAVGYLGAFTGVLLGINRFTIAVASLLGAPGVAGMLLLKFVLVSGG